MPGVLIKQPGIKSAIESCGSRLSDIEGHENPELICILSGIWLKPKSQRLLPSSTTRTTCSQSHHDAKVKDEDRLRNDLSLDLKLDFYRDGV